MGREPLPKRFSLTPSSCDIVVLCGISTCFQVLSPSLGQVIHVLLTRAPLRCQPKSTSPFDLHVLGTPPAFVLSQDQTLYYLYINSSQSYYLLEFLTLRYTSLYLLVLLFRKLLSQSLKFIYGSFFVV